MIKNNNKIPSIVTQRAQKWDHSFGDHFSEQFTLEILELGLFKYILDEKTIEGDLEKSKKRLQPIINIIKNEARLLKFTKNQLVFSEHDYGNSAYIILEGQVSLAASDKQKKYRAKKQHQKGFLSSIYAQLARSKWVEVRKINKNLDEDAKAIIHQNVNLSAYDVSKNKQFGEGEIIGLLSAIRRAPRSLSAITKTNCVILEIKWQGLRDLMSSSKQFKAQCDFLYRERGLYRELQKIKIFQGLSRKIMDEISAKVIFESFGKRNWLDTKFHELGNESKRLAESEPRIVSEGDYASAINIISYGFVRVSKRLGTNEVTVGFLKAGDIIGLSELYHMRQDGNASSYQNGYTAIGYVDIIRIPLNVFNKYLVDNNELQIEQLIAENAVQQMSDPTLVSSAILGKNTAIINKLINNRLINGSKAMVIDSEACIGCDDCVRACASNHAQNPRFVRQGIRVEKLLVINACMHCVDPLCLIGCPTGAIRREEEGLVIINDSICIGCATCANNCPYQNIRMVHVFDDNGNVQMDENQAPIVKASKCDFCYQQKVAPACERACPHGALKRLDLQNINQLLSWVEA